MDKGKKAVKMILFVIMPLLYFGGLMFLVDKMSKEEVNKNTIDRVPVVVLSKDEIKLMTYASVQEYIKEHPDYSFLIPKEKQTCLQKQLQSSHPGVDASWSFQVTQLSNDRQYIEVDCFGDHRDVGFYEATGRAVFPKYIKSYGPPHAVIMFVLSLLLTGLSWAFGSFLLVFWRKVLFHRFV